MERKRVRIPKDQMMARNKIIVTLYEQGYTPKKIVECLKPIYSNLTSSNVGAILAKLKIPAHNPNLSASAKKAAAARWSNKAEKEDQLKMVTEAPETPEQPEITKKSYNFKFTMAKCIEGGTVRGYEFREGDVFPILGNNNGVHVCFEKKAAYGDTSPDDILCWNINGDIVCMEDREGPPIFEYYDPEAECLNMLLRVVEYMTGVGPETLLREINHYRAEAKINDK